MGIPPDESGAGLAFLVSQGSRGMVPSTSHCSTLLPHVFDFPEAAGGSLCQHNGDIDYQQLDEQIKQQVAQRVSRAADANAASPSSGLTSQATGRLGPRDAAIDRQSVCGNFSYSSDNLTIESYGNFSSCRANVAVFKGKWCYECTVLTPGIQQIGWATIHCPFTTEEGVGDAPDSYAVDGKRQRKWSVKPQPYGEAWVQGDVIGCAIDLDAGTITFYRNGQSMGVAYNRVRTMQPSLAYFPAVSLSHTERCRLNFGAKPLIYPIEGHQPLHMPPNQADRAAADYYSSCLGRLVRTAADQQAGRRSSSSSSSGGSSSGGSSSGGSGSHVHVPEGRPGKAADSLQHGLLETAAVAAPATHAAALAAAGSLGLARPRPTACSVARTSAPGAWPQAFAGGMLSSADIVLLGAIVLQPLQQLLVGQPYLVHSSLLPVLLELQREGEAAGQQRALQQLLQLALLVWDQQDFNSVMMTVLEELAYRCQVSPLLAQDFPNTAGYPYLALAVSLLQHPVVMQLFVPHPDFTNILEGLLARKSPSPKDLQVLLPHVWWKGCKDETTSEERLKASMSIITATLAKVEQCQYELMEQLLAVPFQGGRRSSNSSDSGTDEGDCALLVFLRFLLQKNRAALRDVPPPGLSEPTVLMTTFFGLLRLLQPALQAAQQSGTGPLAVFPAAQLLAGANAEAEGLPVFDVPRLGGIVSHLSREHPLSGAEQQPIATVLEQVQGKQLQQQQQHHHHVAPAVLQDAWVPELLNSCLLLYAWRVGFSYKMIHNLSSSVASSSTTLDELDRMIAAGAESADTHQASSWLLGTRKVYRDELTRDVRLLTLLRAAFFSPAKQQALASLSSYLARLLANIAAIPPPSPSPAQSAAEQNLSTAAVAAAAAAAARESSSSAGGLEQAVSSDAGAEQDDQSHLSNLLRYIPVVYAEVVIDYLTALRRLDDKQPSDSDSQAADYAAYVPWLCGCLNDPRIANPDVQESLLQVVGLLLDHASFRVVLESQPERARQLLAALLVIFDSRLWHPASGVLLKVISDSGFGQPAPQQQVPHSLQHLLLELIEAPAEDGTAAADTSGRSEASAAAAAAADAVRTKRFMNKLFNTLNWTLTEFTVSVGDLHSRRGRRSILEAQNQYRRTGLMFELSVNFMRTLEFIVPTKTFISSTVNRTRLRELLQFVLSHFTNGPDARRLNELLQDHQVAAAAGAGSSSSGGGGGGGGTATTAPGAAAVLVPMPGQQGAAAVVAAPAPASLASVVPAYANQAMSFERNSLSERVQKPELLAPVMGILLSLWNAHKAAEAVGSDAGADVLNELAEMADERFMSAMQFMQDVDWSAAFPSIPLAAPLRAFAQLLDTLAAARAAHEAAAATALPADVPDEFLDPITMDLLKDPVRLPDSQIVVDRGTIERHLLSSETDPFSRAPLKLEQLQPDEELKARIQQWLAQSKTAAEEQQQQQQQQQ